MAQLWTRVQALAECNRRAKVAPTGVQVQPDDGIYDEHRMSVAQIAHRHSLSCINVDDVCASAGLTSVDAEQRLEADGPVCCLLTSCADDAMSAERADAADVGVHVAPAWSSVR